MRTARLTVLIATLFAALAVPTLAQASDPHQWSVNARAGRINAATSYELINNDRARVSDYPDADLTVSHHHLTVDLGWGRDGNWQFVGRNPRDHRTLPAGATVALYNAKYHKYLYHAIQGFGVDLDTSDSPVYEWKVDGSSGALSLYDTDAKSFLIRKHETWGIDLGWQRDGPPPTQVGTVHSASVFMTEQPIVEGFVPYLGSYGGGGFPAVLTSVQNPSPSHALSFVKIGHSSEECGDPTAIVQLGPGQTMTPAQIQAEWGSSTPSLQSSLPFLACVIGDPSLTTVAVNIMYRVTADTPYGRRLPGSGRGHVPVATTRAGRRHAKRRPGGRAVHYVH